MVHWPMPGKHVAAYLALEELVRSGKARGLGVLALVFGAGIFSEGGFGGGWLSARRGCCFLACEIQATRRPVVFEGYPELGHG